MGNPRAGAGAIKLARSNRVSDFSGRNESMGWLFSARFSSAPAGGPLSCPRCPCPAARGQSPGSAARGRAPRRGQSRPDRRPVAPLPWSVSPGSAARGRAPLPWPVARIGGPWPCPAARGQSPGSAARGRAPLPVASRPDRWPRGRAPLPVASRPDRWPRGPWPRCRGQSPGSAAPWPWPRCRGQSPGSAAPWPCPAARPPPRLLTVSEIGSWKFAQMPNRKAKRLGASSAKSQPL